jgi:hypothetical protein
VYGVGIKPSLRPPIKIHFLWLVVVVVAAAADEDDDDDDSNATRLRAY